MGCKSEHLSKGTAAAFGITLFNAYVVAHNLHVALNKTACTYKCYVTEYIGFGSLGLFSAAISRPFPHRGLFDKHSHIVRVLWNNITEIQRAQRNVAALPAVQIMACAPWQKGCGRALVFVCFDFVFCGEKFVYALPQLLFAVDYKPAELQYTVTEQIICNLHRKICHQVKWISGGARARSHVIIH